MSFLNRVVDERFLAHRRQSTSFAGIVAAVLAVGLFEWRYFVNHHWDWDLLAIALTFVGIKLALMAFYYITD
jgi:hypothetical protein